MKDVTAASHGHEESSWFFLTCLLGLSEVKSMTPTVSNVVSINNYKSYNEELKICYI